MPVNVTQKDKTLQEIIDYCSGTFEVLDDDDYSAGFELAMRLVVDYCRKRLGYSGSMPLEVPNQSEWAKH